jgi:3-deoxy-D-manno-oct-2-ulosonic acid (Kdo) hydroxylase
LHTISISEWQGPFAEADKSAALSTLERGKVLYFPNLAFVPEQSCRDLFSSHLADRKTKNISYNPVTVTVKGTLASEWERPTLQAMMAAFSAAAAGFVHDLLPRYAAHIERARASYRPVEIAGREYSPLKDDKLLHVDAFPSTPTRGRRILRLFCNVNPSGTPRLWHIGEPFEALAEKFLPRLSRSMAPIAYLLAAFGATRGRRSAYDQLMLGLHNSVKRDAAYQAGACYEEFAFPAGSTWICFTDQVVHAAIAGQYALEQTFYLDIAAMADPASSPLRILERMTKQKLC